MGADAERRGLNQEARLASVRPDGVDQGLNAGPNAFWNEAREEQEELRLREKRQTDDDDAEEDGVDEQHPIGADEAQ